MGTDSNNVTKGFCDQDQVTLTLTIDCDFIGIYVALHHDKAAFSTIALQCGQLTCYSFGSITYRPTNETLEVFFQFLYWDHAGRYINFKSNSCHRSVFPQTMLYVNMILKSMLLFIDQQCLSLSILIIRIILKLDTQMLSLSCSFTFTWNDGRNIILYCIKEKIALIGLLPKFLF